MALWQKEANTHHPQLVRVVADEDCPVLGRVWVVVDALGDHLAQTRVLGEPLAGEPADGVPADLDIARLAIADGLCDGHDVGRLAEAGGALEGQLALGEVLLPAAVRLG